MPIEKKPVNVAEHVEQYGWHIVKVLGDEQHPPFAYTVGLTFSFEQPELVLVGLNDDLEFMADLLDAMALRVAAGERFAHGDKKRGLLEGFTCSLARFPRSAYAAHLGQAIAFYGSAARFEALQCIWPDTQKRLPWETKVMSPVLGRQPVFLRPDAGPREPVWPFADSHSRRILTTQQVVTGKEPVRFVGRDAEGDWQFLCDTTRNEQYLVVATLGWAYDHDATLKAAAKLAPGEAIVRSELGGRWTVERPAGEKAAKASAAKNVKKAVPKTTKTPAKVAAKPAQKAVTKPAKKAVGKTTQKAAAKPAKQAVAKTTKKAVAKPVKKGVAKAPQKAAAKPAKKAVAKARR